jgi:hypothetical protein
VHHHAVKLLPQLGHLPGKGGPAQRAACWPDDVDVQVGGATPGDVRFSSSSSSSSMSKSCHRTVTAQFATGGPDDVDVQVGGAAPIGGRMQQQN